MLTCRLCISINDSVECKRIFDEKGQPNEFYHLVEKYFPMQIGDISTSKSSPSDCVICTFCWSKMDDFYRFQEMVISTHSQLHSLEEIKFVVESGLDPEQTPKILESITQIEEVDPFDVAELKLECDSSSNSCHEDVEQPILTRTRTQRKCKTQQETVVTRKMKIEKKKQSAIKNKSKPQKQENITAGWDNKKSRKTQEADAFIAEHWKKNIPCPLCEFVCSSFSFMSKHFQTNHEDCRCYVICCQQKFRSRFHLIDHIKFHLNPQQYHCSHCGKHFASSRGLKIHIQYTHTEKALERRFECNVCHKRFAKKRVLIGHMDIHAEGEKNFICPHCDKRFVLEHRLKIHIRSVHTEPIVCELCGKSVRGRYALKNHLLLHEGHERPTWPCGQCKAELKSKFSLNRHIRLNHHTSTTVYKCGECGKVSLTEEALRSHKSYVHQKERKFKCTICDKSFKVAHVLKEHMTIHTGEDLYKCPHCPRTFRVNANMHHHRKRMHPKEWLETHQQRNTVTSIALDKVTKEIIL